VNSDAHLDEHTRRLEKAIQKAMAENAAIREVLSDLNALGYVPDIWLTIGIALIKQNGPGETSAAVPCESWTPSFEDRAFFRSIGVRWNTASE